MYMNVYKILKRVFSVQYKSLSFRSCSVVMQIQVHIVPCVRGFWRPLSASS